MSKKKLSFNDWAIKHIKDSINLDYMRAYLEEEAIGCCDFLVEHYMDEISDEELLSFTLDAEKFALLMESTITETVKMDRFEAQIKKQCKSIAKESVYKLKQQ